VAEVTSCVRGNTVLNTLRLVVTEVLEDLSRSWRSLALTDIV